MTESQWAGRSMIFGDSKEPAYDHLNAEESMKKRNGSQPGDPAKVRTFNISNSKQHR